MSTVKQLKTESRNVNLKPTSKRGPGNPQKNHAPKANKGAKPANPPPSGNTVRKVLRRTTEDVASKGNFTFAEMGLKQELVRGLNEFGFYKPTWIQEMAIPAALNDRSILARAKNGTGKTGSFLIPILESFDKNKNCVQALIVVSTRELALQVADVCSAIGKYCGVRAMSCFGGMHLSENLSELKAPKKPHVVVGTLGRLAHLVELRALDLSKVTRVVFDEADETVAQDTERTETILKSIHADFRLSLFSATYPHNLKSFTTQWATDIFTVNAMEELTLRGVTQYYSFIKSSEKLAVLKAFLAKLKIHQCIIFCNTTERCEYLWKIMSQMYQGECVYIHSELPQIQRNKIFHTFRDGGVKYLISTDVFTRGIDVPNVNVVINFDFPNESPQYLHRIGRSGRYGQRGLAINLITQQDLELFKIVQQEIQAIIGPIPEEFNPDLYAK